MAAGLLAGVRLGMVARREAWGLEWAFGAPDGSGSAAEEGDGEGVLASNGDHGSGSAVGGAVRPAVHRVLTVMLVGDSRVGKTNLCARLAAAEPQLAEHSKATTAPAWWHVELLTALHPSHGAETHVRVELLDTPGRPEFAPLIVPFYRQCAALALVFDVGSKASFAKLQNFWLDQVQSQRLGPSPQTVEATVVLAHVTDERRERQV